MQTTIALNEDEETAVIRTSTQRIADRLRMAGASLLDEDPNGWRFAVPKWGVIIEGNTVPIRLNGHKRKSRQEIQAAIDAIGKQAAEGI